MEIVQLADRWLEDARTLRTRLGIKEMALRRAIADGMPKPVWIGKKRYFDRSRVDEWFLSRVK